MEWNFTTVEGRIVLKKEVSAEKVEQLMSILLVLARWKRPITA